MQVAVSDEDGLAPNVFVMCQHATLMHFAAIFGFSAVFLLCLFLFLSVLCWVFLAMSLDPLPACPCEPPRRPRTRTSLPPSRPYLTVSCCACTAFAEMPFKRRVRRGSARHGRELCSTCLTLRFLTRTSLAWMWHLLLPLDRLLLLHHWCVRRPLVELILACLLLLSASLVPS